MKYVQIWEHKPYKTDVHGHWAYVGGMEDGHCLPIELLLHEIPPGSCFEIGEVMFGKMQHIDVEIV
jgi:hypothetical protein